MSYYLNILGPVGTGDVAYQTGLIDDANPAPEGAEVFKTEKQLEAAVAKIDRAGKVSLPDFTEGAFHYAIAEAELDGLTAKDIAARYKVAEIRAFARALGVDSRGKEAEVAARIEGELN